MRCWIKQRHGKLDTWLMAELFIYGDRIKAIIPDCENILIDCSKNFFKSEVVKGRIIPYYEGNIQNSEPT